MDQNNNQTMNNNPEPTGVLTFAQDEVNRIVLTRPAVEAGENLGFLPGDLKEKVDPYLRPLYDALYDMLGPETFQKYQDNGAIEVAPLAYMRGRTLDDSFIILDEAQNTTPEQMKMFLTRLGNNSKAVVTGDVTQIDLPDGKMSGLKQVMKILQGVEDIAICACGQADVVRHQLVNDMPLGRSVDEAIRIVDALQHYEQYGEVCPLGWHPGQEAMKPTHEGVAEYLGSHAAN